jgi:hypothetical protein
MVALGLVGLLSGTAGAGPRTRVPIRPTPKPDQVVHVTTTQEILLRTGDKAEEPGPAEMSSKGVLAYTQSNGKFDDKDRMEAQVTIERLEVEDSMRGRARPAPDTTKAKGRIVVVVFDRSGKLLSIKVPPDMREVSAKLTQLLAGAYGMLNFLPAVDLGVGEETTTSSELPMRLPGNVAQGPLEARVNLTLSAIDKKGKDRVARLQQRIDVQTTTSQLKMTGGGTIDVNLDRGFVASTDTEWKISGVVPGASGGAQSPPFYGSIKISVMAK